MDFYKEKLCLVLPRTTIFIIPNTTFLYILTEKRLNHINDKRFDIPSIVECINSIKLVKANIECFKEI